MLAAALLGALVALFISHRRGIYYALLTIAFGQVFWFVAIKWHSAHRRRGRPAQHQAPAGGFRLRDASISRATRPCSTSASPCSPSPWSALWRLVHSPLGRVLSAIKQNETRAAFVGYNVWLYKWLAFTVSAGVAGLAGGMFAMAQQSAYPNVMSLHNSGFVVMMVLIGGGLVSFWGPVIGAAFFILARDLLGAYTETWLLWYGLVFMAWCCSSPRAWPASGRPGARAQARPRRQRRRSCRRRRSEA